MSIKAPMEAIGNSSSGCFVDGKWKLGDFVYDKDGQQLGLNSNNYSECKESAWPSRVTPHIGLPGWVSVELDEWRGGDADRGSILLSNFPDLIDQLRSEEAREKSEAKRLEIGIKVGKIEELDNKYYNAFANLINNGKYEDANDLRLEWIEVLGEVDASELPSKYLRRLNKLKAMQDLSNPLLMRLKKQYVHSINAGDVASAERWQKLIILEENKNKVEAEKSQSAGANVTVQNAQSAIPDKIVIEHKTRHTFKEGGEAVLTLAGKGTDPKTSAGLTLVDILFDR